MKLLNKISLTVCIALLSFVFTIDATAQCKRYTKKDCLPSLSPYMHNGQLTSAVLYPGDSADVALTFNAGKEYRIIVCNQEQIGNVQFKILDKSRKILYKSDPEEHNPVWDFKVENTQQFIIQLTVPAMEKSNQKTNLVPNGCVALLVGFKE
jgi:hypothetical protein